EAPGSLSQFMRAFGQVATPADLERELTPGRPQRLVDTGEHPAKPVGAVGRQEAQPVRMAVRAELVEGPPEGFAPQHRALRVVQLPEAWVEPGRERIGLEQPQAEAVNRRDPGAVELTGEIVSPALG